MSKFMLSDENTMNEINPFVVADFSLPGGWSEPQPYIDDTVDSKVHIASEGIVAGYRTIDSVAAIKPNCPMSRPLEPIRDNDYDIVVPRIKNSISSSILSTTTFDDDNLLYVALAIVIVLLLTN